MTMEEIAESIIAQWKEETGYDQAIPLSSVELKYVDHEAGIYTIYINNIVRIKSIKDPIAWKIIEM